MSTVLVPIVLVIASFGLGYHIGTFPLWLEHKSSPNKSSKEVDIEEHEAQIDQEGIPDGNLSAIKAGLMEACKMVLVVRTDIKLSPGDIASQCSQATLSCYRALTKTNETLVRHWEVIGQAKIALKSKSEDELLELEAVAKSLNLCARVVRARNVIGVHDGTPTVLGIGPAPVNLVNEVTGKLRLL